MLTVILPYLATINPSSTGIVLVRYKRMVNKWTSFMPLDGFAVRLEKTATKNAQHNNLCI